MAQQPKPSSLQAELLDIARSCGIEGIARSAGVIDPRGDIPSLRTKSGVIVVAPTSVQQPPQPQQHTAAVSPSATTEAAALARSATVAQQQQQTQQQTPLQQTQQQQQQQQQRTQTSTGRGGRRGRTQRSLQSIQEALALCSATATSAAEAAIAPQPAAAAAAAAVAAASAVQHASASASGAAAGDGGLRHFSLLVKEKVEQLRTTTYKTVADELVQEAQADAMARGGAPINDQNMRRRVYDVLNVLAAVGSIDKVRKTIRWRGVSAADALAGPPATAASQASDNEDDDEDDDDEGGASTAAERRQRQQQRRKPQPLPHKAVMEDLQRRRRRLESVLERKRARLDEYETQATSYDQLVRRNRAQGASAVPGSSVQLPFLIVHTSSSALVECNHSEDRRHVNMVFDQQFEVNQDSELLDMLGLGQQQQQQQQQEEAMLLLSAQPPQQEEDDEQAHTPIDQSLLLQPLQPTFSTPTRFFSAAPADIAGSR